jgi:restriction endonuclease S subunit
MIPKDWKNIELRELFEFKNGLNAGKESYGNGVKFINVMEVIYNDCITIDKIPGSVQLQNGQMEAYSVKKGDVLFNRTSETQEEIGLAAVYLDDVPVVFGGFVIRARPLNDWLDDHFKKYCFLSKDFREQAIERGQGGIRTNIGQADLEKIKLLTPPISEQKQIAEILSTWDKSIETLTQLKAAKHQIKKGLMQQLLTGKKRLPGFKGAWQEKELIDYCINSKRAIVDGPFGSNLKTIHFRKKGIPVINSSFVTDLVFRPDEYVYVDEELFIKEIRSKVGAGDIIMAKIGARCGASAIMPEGHPDSILSGNSLKISIDTQNNSTLFIWYQLINEYQDNQFIDCKSVGAQPSISIPELKRFKIKAPEKAEQTEIATILSSLDKEIILIKDKGKFGLL